MTATGDLERGDFAGKRILVLGLGRFAGNLEAVRFLCAEGAEVHVSDVAPRRDLEAPAAEAEALGATLHFGAQTPDLLEDPRRDAVLVSPAMPFDHAVIEAARDRGIPVTTETNIVMARCRAPIHGVTGTKGKSTTAALLAAMLEAAGETVHLGGNIGRGLAARLDGIAPDHQVVLELSSFQLWWMRALLASPRTTVITNLMSDHLDRHGTHAEYARAKQTALDFQGPEDTAVLPADDDAVRAAGWLEAGAGRRVFYRPGDPAEALLDGMPLLGAHNLRNGLAAAAALLAIRPDAQDAVRAGARGARPLPHRLDPVGEVRGVLYLDDSNATHPESTLCALRAVPRPVVLIAGGKDKGVDPEPLFDAIRDGAKAVVAIGSSARVLIEALGTHLQVVPGGPDMAAAVRAAAALAAPGDAVLLSPGYSSLDEYVSFAERGERFRAAVRALPTD